MASQNRSASEWWTLSLILCGIGSGVLLILSGMKHRALPDPPQVTLEQLPAEIAAYPNDYCEMKREIKSLQDRLKEQEDIGASLQETVTAQSEFLNDMQDRAEQASCPAVCTKK